MWRRRNRVSGHRRGVSYPVARQFFGDAEGAEDFRRDLQDWLSNMALVPAEAPTLLDGPISHRWLQIYGQRLGGEDG
jgi:hypothetical protein